MRERETTAGHGTTASHRGRFAAAVALALGALAVVASACSGGGTDPGVASVAGSSGNGQGSQGQSTGGGGQSSPAASGQATAGGGQSIGLRMKVNGNALAFAQCMQSHGVTDFPDPNSQGIISVSGGPGSDLDPNSPTFQKAQKACQKYNPPPSAAQIQQMEANALKFSQCMQSHGLPDFPDPSTSGGGIHISIRSGPGSDLDPNSPTFQKAQQACQKYMGLGAGHSGGKG